jgi:hypothetical protein
MADPAADRDRRARYGLFGLVSLVLLAVLGVLVLALGRPAQLPLPGWAVALVEARLDRALGPGMALTLGGVAIDLPGPGRAGGLSLAALRLSGAGGDVALALPRAGLTAADGGGALILDGARLTLRRDTGGGIALAVAGPGAGAAAWELGAGTLTGFAEALAHALDRPGLGHLARIEARGITLFYQDRVLGRVWEIADGRIVLRRSGASVAIALTGTLVQPGGPPARVRVTLDRPTGAGTLAVSAGFSGIDVAAIGRGADGPRLTGAMSGHVAAALTPGGPAAPVEGWVAVTGGGVAPLAGAAPLALDRARARMVWRPADATLEIAAAEFAAPGGRAAVSGRIRRDPGGRFLAQFGLAEATLAAAPGGPLAAPLRLTGGGADLRIDPAAAQVTLGQAWARDDAGALWRASGALTLTPDGPAVAADLAPPLLSRDRLLALWPSAVQAPTRAWLAENLQAGTLARIAGGLRIAPGQAARFAVSFDVDGMRLTPLAGLPPIRGGMGHALLTESALQMRLTAGEITLPGAGALDLAGSEFAIPDIAREDAPAIATIRARGGLAAALALLDHPPFGFSGKGGIPADAATGQVAAEARIALPLVPDIGPDAVDLAARAELTDVASEVLVPGRTLAAERLALRADNAAVVLSGEATLDGLPVDAEWRQPLAEGAGGGQITGTVELSQRFLDIFGIGLSPGAVTGAGRGALTIDLPQDAPAGFALRSDLAGIGLSLPALGWALAPGATGDLRAEGVLGPAARIDRLTLDAPGLTLDGRIDLEPGGALAAARFDRVRAGGWLDAAATLTGQGPGRPPALSVTGGSVDLRRLPPGPGGGAAAGPVELRLDRAVLTDRIALTGIAGTLAAGAGLSGRLTARVNGGARVAVTLTPGPGGTDIQLLANDAGAALRAAGLSQALRGGTLDLRLRAQGGGGRHEGTLALRDFRVRDAPVLAGLLSAISIVGLIEQLDGEGLAFSAADAAFALAPGRLFLHEASATGPSLGLSAEGVADTTNGIVDLQGVVSPVYLLNGMLQETGLFGGLFGRGAGEGIIGFSYTLRGPAAAPRIAVNPLSALAPGALRQLFRGPVPGAGDAG